MKTMLTRAFAAPTLLALLLTGCGTSHQVGSVDPETGRLRTDATMGVGTASATVVKSEPVNLDDFGSRIFVHGAEFYVQQTRELALFDTVIEPDEMERIVVRERLGDRVSSVHTLIGWNQLAEHYGPFLVLKPDVRRDGNRRYLQLKAIDPGTGDELFLAERHMDFAWTGVTDQNTRYPLFNAFIDWLELNQ
ncbi:MAG: hypothetical protein JJU00_00360 [Opitutales bacterium]|nr:hypothetical protein [Opitutales bacterium]